MRFDIATKAAFLVCSRGFEARRVRISLVQVGHTEGEGTGNLVAIAVAHSSEGRGGMEFIILLFPRMTSMGSGAVANGNTNIVKLFGRKIEDLRPSTRLGW
jgi:hypothetical protein